MDTATWVIAGASIGNVIVLGLYAYFMWGLWSEAARTALRTEELVRQATDALRLQVCYVRSSGRAKRISASCDRRRRWSY
jgi:hypothetical protein